MTKQNYKTIYVIRHFGNASNDYWCYLDQIFFSRKQAKKYCKARGLHPLLIKKITLRGEKK